MSPNYVLAVSKRFGTRPAGGDDLTQRCQLAAAICDLSIILAFGHNELWFPKVAISLSVTFQMLWPLVTTICFGRRLQK